MIKVSPVLLEPQSRRVYKRSEHSGAYMDVADGVAPVNSYVRSTEVRTSRLTSTEPSKHSPLFTASL